MSFCLYARALPKKRPKPLEMYQLKFVIRDELLEHDGSLREGPYTIGPSWIPYLRGVLAASGNGDVRSEANQLIELIRKNSQGVQMWVGDPDDV